jgi:hypothetical protein
MPVAGDEGNTWPKGDEMKVQENYILGILNSEGIIWEDHAARMGRRMRAGIW